MDRPIFFAGELPICTDLLFAIRAAMISDGNLAQMVFGTGTVFDGLAVAPTSPASLSVNVGPGRILVNTTVDSNTYGTLATDGDAVMKLGINTGTTVLGPFTAPATAGQSVDIVIEAAFSEADSAPVVLPYFNSANPQSPFSGPANSNVAQNTRRLQTVTLNVVVGTAATTGSQTVPSLTAGFVGLAVITIANGATTITSGNISTYPGAPSVAARIGATNQGFGALQRLTGSGNFIVPNGVTRLRYSLVAAGGGGQGNNTIGAGGGGGGAAKGYLTGLTAGSAIAYACGAAGTPGASSGGGAGGAGGSTTFGGVTATGGGGGNGSGGAGGSASGGQDNLPGMSGLPSGTSGIGGSGGANGLGNSGGAINNLGAGGFAGTFFGTGGSAAAALACLGGPGTAGTITVEY
jgi:hypothetical protein